MGEVYRAEDLKLGQIVAIKFLPASLSKDAGALARFHSEVRIARQVSHPNVCRVFDIGDADGVPFLTMEYVDGEDLASLVRRIGRLPSDKAIEIARQVCAGLAAAHERGVIHRDLKPANLMLDGTGKIRITDFGLAAIAASLDGADVRAGTPAYRLSRNGPRPHLATHA
jgi:serine/threonine-protein kinase